VADCCLIKLSPIASLVAVKRRHRCRLVVWHGHSANQINCRRRSTPGISIHSSHRCKSTPGLPVLSVHQIVMVHCTGSVSWPCRSALTKSKRSIIIASTRDASIRLIQCTPTPEDLLVLLLTIHSSGRTAIHIHVAVAHSIGLPRTLRRFICSIVLR
jgi:hypothetical protein